MRAELIDYMGDDLRVVNSARVSFDKESWYANEEAWLEFDESLTITEQDQKLISYLAKHGHWTPFSHVMITMRETVPIFVARQRFKHMVGFTYNEISRRYVDNPPEFYKPAEWRGKPINAKQGSSDEVINLKHWDFTHSRKPKHISEHKRIWEETFPNEPWNPINGETEVDGSIHDALNAFYEDVEVLYDNLINAGVAPEQARMILPQSMYTSYYCTGSLAAWARAYKLRSDEHAQKEIRDLAKQWGDIIGQIDTLKYSWKSLTEN